MPTYICFVGGPVRRVWLENDAVVFGLAAGHVDATGLSGLTGRFAGFHDLLLATDGVEEGTDRQHHPDGRRELDGLLEVGRGGAVGVVADLDGRGRVLAFGDQAAHGDDDVAGFGLDLDGVVDQGEQREAGVVVGDGVVVQQVVQVTAVEAGVLAGPDAHQGGDAEQDCLIHVGHGAVDAVLGVHGADGTLTGLGNGLVGLQRCHAVFDFLDGIGGADQNGQNGLTAPQEFGNQDRADGGTGAAGSGVDHDVEVTRGVLQQNVGQTGADLGDVGATHLAVAIDVVIVVHRVLDFVVQVILDPESVGDGGVDVGGPDESEAGVVGGVVAVLQTGADVDTAAAAGVDTNGAGIGTIVDGHIFSVRKGRV